jgi:integrase
MAINKLKDRTLQKYYDKAQPKQLTLADGDGLSARVSPLGGISWLYRYRLGGKIVWLTLGKYSDDSGMTIAMARAKRDECRQWLADGKNPKVELQLQKIAIEKPVTVGEALELWITKSGRANGDKHRQQFNRWFSKELMLLPFDRIGQDQVIACFTARQEEFAAAQKKYPAVAAAYVLANFKQAVKFCRSRRVGLKCDAELLDIEVDDVGGEKQAKRSRRLVSDTAEGGTISTDYGQLTDLLHYLDGPPKGIHWHYWRTMLLACIYFGCRTQEIRLSRRKEWDLDRRLWTVPPAHNKSSDRDQKSGREGTIVRPIPQSLLPWLNGVLDGLWPDDYVLGELKRPETVAMFGGSLHKKLGHVKWTLHDLRRTFATCVAGLGIGPHIVEALLGHSLGGVAGIYNRQSYLTEQMAALELWAQKVAELRGGTGESPTKQ